LPLPCPAAASVTPTIRAHAAPSSRCLMTAEAATPLPEQSFPECDRACTLREPPARSLPRESLSELHLRSRFRNWDCPRSADVAGASPSLPGPGDRHQSLSPERRTVWRRAMNVRSASTHSLRKPAPPAGKTLLQPIVPVTSVGAPQPHALSPASASFTHVRVSMLRGFAPRTAPPASGVRKIPNRSAF
jgi:hypothetical protein